MLNRFKRLLGDLTRGQLVRNTFTPWEVALLLDFEACELPPKRRTEILRQYQRAVERQLSKGAGPPMMLSHFLVLREQRRRENQLKSAERDAHRCDTCAR